jgi:glycosyltransferase involved in cell wall biosynthesis
MSKIEIEAPSVSVIIPAYNEEAFLETTVSSVLNTNFPCEVIVVNDGSTDRTQEIIERFGNRIKAITHAKNKGKGAAMASGIREATGEIVVFCDAHLLGLKHHHLLSLVLPLVYGSAKAVLGIGIPEELSASLISFVPFFILTGQRAYYRKDIEPLTTEMEKLGYGVETYLFAKFPRDKTALVLLPGLVHLTKQAMLSKKAIVTGYLRETREVLGTITKLTKRKIADSITNNKVFQERK